MENLDDELRELTPLLSDLKHRPPGLQVPEDYFDSLEAQVFSRLDTAGARRPAPALEVTHGGRSRIRIWMALAAGLAVLAAAFWFVRTPTVTTPSTPLAQATATELSEEEVEAYLLENIHEFDVEQLATLPPADFVDIETEMPASPPTNGHRSKKQQALDDLHPEDLNNLLDELSEEDLEKLL